MDNTFLTFFILFILLGISAFFSASETAFSSVNKIRLKNYADKGDKRAHTALYIVKNFDRALSTILVGNNIVNITSSAIATMLAVSLFGSSGALISTVAMTLLILTFGEITPKSIAKEYSENFALSSSKILKFLMKILYPIVIIFIKLKDLLIKIFHSKKKEPSVTEQELKYIIDSIEKEGVLEKEESNLVKSALEFDEKTAKDILIPRVDILAIDIDDPIEINHKIILKERYSRIPVYKESIDNIIGILHTRDYLESIVLGKKIDIIELIKPAHFIYKTKKLSFVLSDFKKNKLHIAIVSDDFGGTVGMLTMEDLLEQIVGDIWDEDEEITHKFIKLSNNIYEVSGDINIHEMFDLLEIYDQNFKTDSISLSGWILELFGQIPKQGDSIEYKNIQIKVKEIIDQRITKLIVKKIDKKS